MLYARLADGRAIAAADEGQGLAGIEQPGVEKIGALAAGLQRELAEAEDPAADDEVEELFLVIEHAAGFQPVGSQLRHTGESRYPLPACWIPAFAGMTMGILSRKVAPGPPTRSGRSAAVHSSTSTQAAGAICFPGLLAGRPATAQ